MAKLSAYGFFFHRLLCEGGMSFTRTTTSTRGGGDMDMNGGLAVTRTSSSTRGGESGGEMTVTRTSKTTTSSFGGETGGSGSSLSLSQVNILKGYAIIIEQFLKRCRLGQL